METDVILTNKRRRHAQSTYTYAKLEAFSISIMQNNKIIYGAPYTSNVQER